MEELRRQSPPFLPDIDAMVGPAEAPFMAYSTCSTRDFYHPEFVRLSRLAGHEPFYHRKLWEWIFVLHHAFDKGAVGEGRKALGFGVGTENLPAVFARAGMRVTATDAPPEIGIAGGWTQAGEFSQGVETIPSLDMERADFERLVTFQCCDMNQIDPSLIGFDLCWSSCALEHLGDMRKGIDFILNSVEKTLKPGGIAIHTTEFNLSSNNKTMDSGWCVLYRRRDFDALVDEVRARGHEIEAFRVAPDCTVIDSFVDHPPYLHAPHLKLELQGYVTTSAGIVVRRGK